MPADPDRPGLRSTAPGLLFGRRLANEEEVGERLSKTKALAIFSSDAISSSAYATEEILRVLVLAGVGALFSSVRSRSRSPLLLAVVVVSATARSVGPSPMGGGAYAVARTNSLRSWDSSRRSAPHRLRHDRRGLDVVGRDQLIRWSPRPRDFKIEIAFV